MISPEFWVDAFLILLFGFIGLNVLAIISAIHDMGK
jgi:hypothetical protein